MATLELGGLRPEYARTDPSRLLAAGAAGAQERRNRRRARSRRRDGRDHAREGSRRRTRRRGASEPVHGAFAVNRPSPHSARRPSLASPTL